MTSTTSWSSESSSKTKEMGSHSLSLAMILTCCRPCLSNVYLNSLEKKKKKIGEQRTEKGQKMFFKLSEVYLGKGSISFSTVWTHFRKTISCFNSCCCNWDKNCYTKQNVTNRLSSTDCLQRRTYLLLPCQTPKYMTKGKVKNIWFLFSHTQNCRWS